MSNVPISMDMAINLTSGSSFSWMFQVVPTPFTRLNPMMNKGIKNSKETTVRTRPKAKTFRRAAMIGKVKNTRLS